MSKKMKLWLLIATSAVVVGSIIFGVVMSMLGWDFSKLSTVKYETNNYEIRESFENIRIDTDTADVVFLPSEDGRTRVVCKELEKVKHTVKVEEDTLVISVVDTRRWFDYIGIYFGRTRITVYIPEKEYSSIFVKTGTGDVNCVMSASGLIKIRTSTGQISVENLSAGALELAVSTGDVSVTDVTCKGDVKIDVSTGKAVVSGVRCKNLISDGNTGDVILNDVVATGKFDIERSTGDVIFDRCDAMQIEIETDTGNVKGSLLSDKIFIVETDTGRVNVPKTTAGGRCEISTDTGDIRIEIVNP